MPYATKSDIINLYGDDHLIDLLPDNVADADATIDEALQSASAELDAYLSARYALPLKSQPVVLKRPTVDIASYVLAARQSRLTEVIEDRYEQAIKLARDIASGKAGLGSDEPQIDTGSGTSQSGSFFSANTRKFGRSK